MIPVLWVEVGRCTECAALVRRDDADEHVAWHVKWGDLAIALRDLARAQRTERAT